jgi:hypothetical protein
LLLQITIIIVIAIKIRTVSCPELYVMLLPTNRRTNWVLLEGLINRQLFVWDGIWSTCLVQGSGYLSRYNYWLRDGRPGFESLHVLGLLFSRQCFQTGSGAHQTSYWICIGVNQPKREGNHIPQSSAWSCTQSYMPTYVSRALCLMNNRTNLILQCFMFIYKRFKTYW